MVAPSVVNTFLEDLYISPIQIIEGDGDKPFDTINLKKKETVQYGNNKLRFVDYEMGSHAMGASDMTITANIEVLDSYDKVIEVIKPGIKMIGQNRENITATFPGTGQNVQIEGLSVEEQLLILSIEKIPGENSVKQANKELLAVEVSRKPLINVLWLGTIILVTGFVTTIFNRTKRQKL
jgi:cytochrome c-type biogenesis protein CcmF